jgi:hypothetical protein
MRENPEPLSEGLLRNRGGGEGGGALVDWRIFRDQVLARVRARGDARYDRYVSGTTDRAWAHIRAEGCFTPEEAEERFFSFYLQDAPFLDE